MIKKIFRSILLTSLISLLGCLIIITGVLYKYFNGIQKKRLKTEFNLVSSAVDQNGLKYLSSLKTKEYRLTWVSADGTVLFDNVANAQSMDNHANREEIKEALTSGTGESERYSSTITEKTLYFAGLLSNGTVLRISSSHATVFSIFLGMIRPILIIFAIILILSVFISSRMAKRIVEPLNGINLENPLENDAYEELSPLLRKINQLHSEVIAQVSVLKIKTDEFEQIISSMNEGLVLLDNKGIVISINNSAMSLFGSDKDCVGQDFLTVERSHDIQEAINNCIDKGNSEICIERNGRQYQVDISRISVDDNAVGTVLLTFDVTDKVFAERNRREFTANVSHELKTPLQSIMGSAELIENGLVKQEDMPRFVGHIRTEAARLVTLIEDIIRLSQLDEGNDMKTEQVDLLMVSSEVVSELKYLAEKKNIDMKLTGSTTVVSSVRKLISEIVFNLCDNAIKYTQDGGTVEIEVLTNSNNAILKVSDTGIGIPPEHQTRIFERFYRVDKSHSKESGGTGLGLSIVKHAVQYLHGEIDLESDIDKGSIFTVIFPL